MAGGGGAVKLRKQPAATSSRRFTSRRLYYSLANAAATGSASEFSARLYEMERERTFQRETMAFLRVKERVKVAAFRLVDSRL